jgi:8-oxo-dGTP pyrophosphatase MutT (NUDIX family)
VDVAEDLAECRQRGLDWLDRSVPPQRKVRAASLQALAASYVAARNLPASSRITQIKVLLADGMSELDRQGNTSDAGLLRDLFFGSSFEGTIPAPGELLQTARKKAGESEAKFRERRNSLLRSFAQFLIQFVQSAPGLAAEAGITRQDSVSAHYQRPQTGFAPDHGHFTELLGNAVNATIVGITNERLLAAIRVALDRKRELGPPDAFWNSLRIVFLGQSLLEAVNDEREEFNDPQEALRQRHLEQTWARRSIGVFLKRTHSTRWALYDWPYIPVLTGSLFEFQDGSKLVHLLIRPPRRSSSDYLFIDVNDNVDRFSAVFEDIVHHSMGDTMIVPVGAPAGGVFQCNEVRPHARVLKDGSAASGWLPMVIVITSRPRNGKVEAFLQLRTAQNAAREENRLSHLGGHILHEDRVRPSGRPLAEVPKAFDSTHETPLSAARRLVRNATGADPGATLRAVTTGSYLYPDKEHLFFFVFALELPESQHVPRQSEMHPFRLSELLAIRLNQVLTSAASLCGRTDLSQRALATAAEVLALNLTLHDRPDLAETMLDLVDKPAADRAAAAAAMSELLAVQSAPSWMDPSQEVQLEGLAGWHFREFFSALLPLYAEIGIDGAADLSAQIDNDERKRAARDRLAELYQDEHVISVLPQDL